MSRSTDTAVRIATEYREQMIIVGIQRGMTPQEANEFATRCALEQVVKRDEITTRQQVRRKLRK